ncbi:MAG: stalk domain-containing protein, partial [Firmicutes bacterium]|nr:stalk domain-containing protein [Bacillota bacterium]
NGSTIVTINRDTPIYPYLTRNIVTIDQISVGSQLLMWYPAVALSYPAQATATQTVILGQAGLSDWLTVDNKEMTDTARSVSGALPVFSSTAAPDMVKQLNDQVDKLSAGALQTAAADKNTSVYFSYDVFTTRQYTSVVIHTSLNPGNTASDQVTTFVLNTMTAADSVKYHRYALADLLGPNAFKLANGVIAKDISSAAPGAYFTGDNDRFKGLQSEPGFYMSEDNNLTIIFDKYAIAPGVTGTPTFTIPLANVVNITFNAADTLTANGTVLVPLRPVAAALGFKTTWNGSLKTVTLTKGEQTATVQIGSTAFNGTTLAAPPVLRDNSTYVPAALVELGLGGCYQVNQDNGAVTISAVK